MRIEFNRKTFPNLTRKDVYIIRQSLPFLLGFAVVNVFYIIIWLFK